MQSPELIKYQFLMKLRRQFFFSVLSLPVLPFIFSASGFSEQTALWLVPLINVPVILVCMFRLMAYDICPWCKNNFFVHGEGYNSNCLLRTSCACCGEPKNKNTP